MLQRLYYYYLLIRLHRPIGIWLLLWPTLIALWFAGQGQPDVILIIVFSLGVALMRSAGCAINDYADKDFDGHVARTKERPIASGKITPKEALMVFILLSLIAASLLFFLNIFTILLSLVALLLAASYPFMKRFHHLPQIHLGIAFAWAIPMTFAAQTNTLPLLAWILFIATVIWTTAYDTMYAMADKEDDLKIGVKSTAILFGHYDKIITGVLQILAISLWTFAGLYDGRGIIYFIGIIIAIVLSIYQQWLIHSPKKYIPAFLNNHYLGMSLFIALVLDYALANAQI